MFLETHLRLRESRAQRLGCELPVVIQAAAEFPRRPAPDVATPLGPLGRALRTLAQGTGRDNQHGDVPPAQPEGSLQPIRKIPASFPNPFTHLTVRQTVTRKRALSRETIKRICTADLSALHPKYSLARDIFMFSFFTRGMSFVDMVYLRNSDIHDGVLTYARHKTGQMLSMRIEPQLQHIIDRYSNASPYILPVRAKDDSYDNYRQQQRELNKFIRKIGVLLNIPEPLTFYVARHSWATLARDCGTPLTVISAGMGHTSERTTRIYLAQLDHNIIDKANRKIIDLQ